MAVLLIQKMKNFTIRQWIGGFLAIITTTAALVSIIAYFQAPTDQKIEIVTTGVGTVKQASFVLPPPGKNEIDYRKIASPAINENYIGKEVTFRCMFLSEWTDTDVYKLYPIDLKGNVFINHRNINYSASGSDLGSSDLAIPPFPLYVSQDKVDKIYELKRGDIILVNGKVQKIPETSMPSSEWAKIKIGIDEIKKLN